MSDKPAPAAAAPAAAAAADKKSAAAAVDDKKGGKKAKAGGGLLTKTPVLIGAVMAVEAIALFAGFKVLGGGPKNASAQITLDHNAEGSADGKDAEGKAKGKGDGKPTTVELPVCETRAVNRKSGRMFVYDVSLFAVAKADQADKLKAAFSEHDALIKDRLQTIIADMDPDKLGGGSEPGLETLRRQVRFQLEQIVGEGLIQEVLVPRCMPFRTDY